MKELVLNTNEEGIRDAVAEFNVSAASNISRVRSLISTTEYWVLDESTARFGPGKFVGFHGMTFELYDQAHQGQTSGARFDGHVTKVAIEQVLGAFIKDNHLLIPLEAWIESVTGRALNSTVDRAKWWFTRIKAYRAMFGRSD